MHAPITMSTRIKIVAFFLIFILAFLARTIPGPRTIDDSYITYRYARNLLAGEGFVYNPGESVQGTTTPFYTLLMVGVGYMFGGRNADFPLLALFVNAVADGITCLLLIHIGRRLNAELAGYGASLVWAFAPYSVTFAIGGLETSLYVLLLTTAASAYMANRTTLLSIAAALALLTRPDAILLLLPIAIAWAIRVLRKQSTLRFSHILVFFIPVILWYGFAWFTFGSPLPHSVQAKLVAYRLEPYSALIRLIQHYATPFLEHMLLTNKWIAIGAILYPFLYLIGAKKAYSVNPQSLPWLVYPWLYLLTFSIPNPLIFRWYLTPPLPVYFFVILLGLETILHRLKNKGGGFLPKNAIPIVVICVLPLFFTLQGWQIHLDHGADKPAPSMAWYKLELLYQQAAKTILPQITAETTLAAGDVGVLGYFTPAKILDTVGLNSEEALDYYPLDASYYVINYAIAPNLIMDEKPDWLIFLEIYGRNGLLRDPRFIQKYSLFKVFDTDIYGSKGMLIYQCTACK